MQNPFDHIYVRECHPLETYWQLQQRLGLPIVQNSLFWICRINHEARDLFDKFSIFCVDQSKGLLICWLSISTGVRSHKLFALTKFINAALCYVFKHLPYTIIMSGWV